MQRQPRPRKQTRAARRGQSLVVWAISEGRKAAAAVDRFLATIPEQITHRHHLDYVLTRLTVIGAAYLAAICVLPEILIAQYNVPFYFGGTSLLIVVTVTMDTVAQIHSHLLAHQYEGLIKKSKLRGRRG